LTSAAFRYLVFPIGSAALGIYIKYVSRNDRYDTFKKEDIAVGLDLLRTALLMFVVVTTNRALALSEVNKTLSEAIASPPVNAEVATHLQAQAEALSGHLFVAGWIIALSIIALWGVSTVVRKWGWLNETEMDIAIGITIPLIAGVIALSLVMWGAAA